MKQRVAIIEPIGAHVGFDVFVMKLAEHLSLNGAEVRVYTSGTTHEVAGVPIRNWFAGSFDKSRPIHRRFVFVLGVLRSLLDAMWRGYRIANLHLFEYRLPELMIVVASRLFGRKVVLILHDFESFDSSDNDRYRGICYALSQVILVLNESTRALLLSRYPGIKSRVHCVPFGDYLHFRPRLSTPRPTEHLVAPPDRRNFLFFGQIKEVKGLDLLIAATPAVVAKHPEAAFVIAGRTWRTGFEAYDRQIDDANVRGAFFLDVRFIPEEDLLSYFARCEFVVLPYRRIYQSAVLLLAMSLGKLVIVSDVPALAETVQDGVNGFVFRAEDVEDLARTCVRALNTPRDVLDRISANAIVTMERDHNWDLVSTRFLKASESLH